MLDSLAYRCWGTDGNEVDCCHGHTGHVLLSVIAISIQGSLLRGIMGNIVFQLLWQLIRISHDLHLVEHIQLYRLPYGRDNVRQKSC